MGDHSRYDDEGRIRRSQRSHVTGRHRRGPQLAPLPECDATVWDMPPVAAAREKVTRHVHRSLSSRLRHRLAVAAVIAGLVFGGSLGAALASSGRSPAPAHQQRARKAPSRPLALPALRPMALSTQLSDAIRSRATVEAARYTAVLAAARSHRTARRIAPAAPPAAISTPSPSASQPAPPPPAAPGTGPGPHVTYTWGQLESLWLAEGGPASQEANAACIAEHESSGRPWAFNGRDIGIWQIDPGNYAGPASDLYDPVVNAKVAVRLEAAQGWAPWSTRWACGV